jgi:DNA-binding protein HU-beta
MSGGLRAAAGPMPHSERIFADNFGRIGHALRGFKRARRGSGQDKGENRHMMSKSELIQKISDESSVAKKDVKAVMESMAGVAYKELKKSGVFMLPGFAKFMVVKKPATKERTGINPFTKEPTVFKAKPARKTLKVRAVKACKDSV